MRAVLEQHPHLLLVGGQWPHVVVPLSRGKQQAGASLGSQPGHAGAISVRQQRLTAILLLQSNGLRLNRALGVHKSGWEAGRRQLTGDGGDKSEALQSRRGRGRG
jgi:hypothetical protein